MRGGLRLFTDLKRDSLKCCTWYVPVRHLLQLGMKSETEQPRGVPQPHRCLDRGRINREPNPCQFAGQQTHRQLHCRVSVSMTRSNPVSYITSERLFCATDLVLAAVQVYSCCRRQSVKSLHRVEECFSVRVVQLTDLAPHLLNIPNTNREGETHHLE